MNASGDFVVVWDDGDDHVRRLGPPMECCRYSGE